MATFMQWLNADAPTSWASVSARAVKTGVIAFVVLQAKEYYDAGRFDTPATAVDSLLVGVGVFLFYTIVKLVRKT